MYNKGKKRQKVTTSLRVNDSQNGLTIENKIDRAINNKEPIEDVTEVIYTERSEGVQPQYNIRTDRFEVAIEAMDKVTASQLAKREERIKAREEMKIDRKEDSGAEPTQGEQAEA